MSVHTQCKAGTHPITPPLGATCNVIYHPLCTLFFLFTFHFSLFTPVFAGTTGKITGEVTDVDGNPLPGASVVIVGSTRGTVTDEEGVYFLLSIDPGRHTLMASMIGSESQQKENVLVSSDFTTNLSFELKEQALQGTEIVVEAQRNEGGWGMFSSRANAPPVEPDKTTSKYLVRGDDIEALTIVRDMAEFIQLQAGVTVDEDGDDLTIRAGDAEDVAYYFEGIPMPSKDHVETRVYRDFNRLAIQEMTIITGGMDAEYGNAQGGIVSVVSRQGGSSYHGLADYGMTPPGKKHWGANVYDSPMHFGNNRCLLQEKSRTLLRHQGLVELETILLKADNWTLPMAAKICFYRSSDNDSEFYWLEIQCFRQKQHSFFQMSV